jgi:formin-binding protein 1
MQDLNETRVSSLNNIWSLAATIERGTLGHSMDLIGHLASEIPRNKPTLDSMMFARHNTANWQEPGDMVFEASPVWLDDDTLAADEAAKNFLRNVLTKSKSQLAQLKRDEEAKIREVEGAKRVRINVKEGRDKRDEVEIVRALFDLQISLHDVSRQKVTAEVEISTITSAVGDVSVGARNHNFKSETFKIPTNCDYCGERIWGINAKGFNCRDCGFTCHSKCEMKCAADCPGEQTKEEKKKLKAERQENAKSKMVANGGVNGSAGDTSTLSRSDTMNTLSSGYSATAQRSVSGATLTESSRRGIEEESATPKKRLSVSGGARRNRLVAPPPSQYVTSDPGDGANGDSGEQKGKMLYAYQANSDGEISVQDGVDVVVVEEDGMKHSTC